jgi:heptosyltransferase-2
VAIERIYVRLPNWVGDVVMATPLFRSLRDAFPGAEILGHGKERNFEFVDGARFFDRTIPFQRGSGLLGPWLEGRRVRALAGPIDLALVLPNSLSSAIVARATGARRRIGYKNEGRSLLLTDALPVEKREGRLRPIPMVDYYHGLLGPLGVKPTAPRRPVLPVDEAARARASELLAKMGVHPGERVWAINIGANWVTKRWIPEYAGMLADMVAARGAKPVILWGPGEEDLVREAVAASKSGLLGSDVRVPLRDLCALLERCELLITSDSGPRHFGVAAGIPIVALIGSTHPAYTEVDPLPHAPVELCCEKVECWPCHLEKCPIDFRCMKRLLPEKVASAADHVLAAAAAARGR